jgi:hypothetical protein
MKNVFVFLLFSSLFSAADLPKFGWKKAGAETFSLDAAQHKALRIPKGRYLFQFQAEEAIYAGVATTQEYAPFQAGRYLQLADFKRFHCVKTDVIEGRQQCNIEAPNAILAIRDKRGPITKLSALPAIKIGAAGMADKATKANKITLTLFQWACIENCPQQ